MKNNLDRLFAYHIAYDKGYINCLQCGNLQTNQQPSRCHVCHSKITPRKTGKLSVPIAYLLAAIILFFPANLLPIMCTISLVSTQKDTILSGILHLWQTSSYPIAIIVFFASFVTPIFKIISMGYLCYTCKKKSTKNIMFRTKLYRFTKLIGRWSMIDVFVVALLGALVKMESLATIEPLPGILAFTLVVFFTILATEAFDPRLIWDSSKEGYKKYE